MPRGGRRTGAGGKPTWKHGKTKTIRVPDALADKVLQIARILDEQGSEAVELVSDPEVETESKVLDLSGIAVHAQKKGPAIYLADLLKAGYQIKPERLVRLLEPAVEKDLRQRGNLKSFLEEFYE